MRNKENHRVGYQQAIFRFLDTYRLVHTEEKLWMMFRLTLNSEEGNDWNEIQWANWFGFYELLVGGGKRKLGVGLKAVMNRVIQYTETTLLFCRLDMKTK